MVRNIRKCNKCGFEVAKPKHLKKINSLGKVCTKCARENRLKKREYVKRNVAGIRKRSDILKEAAEKRKQRKLIKPEIKSIKHKPKISALGLYLTKNEKTFLYKNLSKRIGEKEAKQRINNLITQMQEIKLRLKEEPLSAKELNKRFKEEFNKLLESMR